MMPDGCETPSPEQHLKKRLQVLTPVAIDLRQPEVRPPFRQIQKQATATDGFPETRSMDMFSKPYRVTPLQAAGTVLLVLVPCTVASAILAGLMAWTGVAQLTTPVLISLAPILYFVWLLLFLGTSSLLQSIAATRGYRRPARLSTTGDGHQQVEYSAQMLLYIKNLMVTSLPMVRVLQAVTSWQQLVYRSWALPNRIHRDAHVWGVIMDPDLVEIGEHSILGSDANITCHSITVQPDGQYTIVTAPVRIGRRVTLGGECRINPGVEIGDDSIVEPRSNVVAYTRIPAGEVWGGNPARFVRRRFDNDSQPESPVRRSPVDSDSDQELTGTIRRIVAESLSLPLEAVPADATICTVTDWDSLGQMGIAAGLHACFGRAPDAARIFQLRSIADIVDWARESVPETKDTRPSQILPRDPELLPLWNHDLATEALALASQHPPAPIHDPLRIVIAATFTAEPLAPTLKLWTRAFGLNVAVEFAGYNQVMQQLLDPNSLFHENRTGLNVVLTRPEDLLSEDRANSADELLDALTQFASQARNSLVVGTLPPVVSRVVQIPRGDAEPVRNHWRERLAAIPDVTTLDVSAIVEDIGTAAAGQTDSEILARTPYSNAVFREMAIQLTRIVRRRRVPPAKVLALDADGILWGGVIAEDGLTGIELGTDGPGRSFRLFQQYIRSLQSQGLLLVLVSRNQPDDVWNVFDHHPGMVLRREDFASYRINWQPKSQNLQELARELNLGLDAFVFVDDDAANRLDVEAYAPGVTVVPMPTDPAHYVQTLSALWRFDRDRVTAEDLSRTRMMQDEHRRRQLESASTDLASYLSSLALKVVMRRASPSDLPRVAQLTQKTNQFNLSLKRRSLAEIQELESRSTILVIEVADRFGEYGLVGVGILLPPDSEESTCELDTFLLSCRVLGRGVEHACLHGFVRCARQTGGRRLMAPFVAGPRNQPMSDFLAQAGLAVQDGIYQIETETDIPLPDHLDWSTDEFLETQTGPSDRPLHRLDAPHAGLRPHFCQKSSVKRTQDAGGD